MHKNTYILFGGQIVTEHCVLSNTSVVVQNGYVHAIEANKTPDEINASLPVIEVDKDHFVLPGFIDLHIHGSAGADVMDGTPAALTTMTESLYQQGVTGFLATTMTESPDTIAQAIGTVANYQPQHDQQAKILGIHLEGPFLSSQKPGAQSPKWLHTPDIELFSSWQDRANGLIRKVTIAPEEDPEFAFIRHLKQQNIIASIGHTCCTAHTTTQAIKAGASQATHLYNAMTGVNHRDAGAATAILLDPQVTAELIVDGIHLCPEIIQLTLAIKGVEHIILVTDAMRAQGVGDGIFSLGGQNVYVKGHEARLESGSLAGSVLSMNQALGNMIKFTGCSLIDASKMASGNSARELGMMDTGVLALGMKADITVLDQYYQVVNTFISYNNQ